MEKGNETEDEKPKATAETALMLMADFGLSKIFAAFDREKKEGQND